MCIVYNIRQLSHLVTNNSHKRGNTCFRIKAVFLYGEFNQNKHPTIKSDRNVYVCVCEYLIQFLYENNEWANSAKAIGSESLVMTSPYNRHKWRTEKHYLWIILTTRQTQHRNVILHFYLSKSDSFIMR